MTTNHPLRVFLCHSSNDKPTVRELYQKLCNESWLKPWLDEEELYPGQDWNLEIEKAVESADAILVFLSKNSITKEGYVQREIRIALDYADYKPEGTLFIIPVRLEECTPPKRLVRWQYADYFEGQRGRAFERLLISLKRRAETLGLGFEESVQSGMPTLDKIRKNKITFSSGMEFVYVSAGGFLMGSKDDNKLAADDERPQHIVDIPYDYWVARYPITNEQYNLFVEASRREHPIFGWEYKKDHPVVYIGWKDAIEYVRWMNNFLRKEIPSGLVSRLPTEKEWEKASRGVDGREYPWGNEFDKNKCNSSESNRADMTPVWFHSPHGDSPYGCSDMVGNVWEWTCSEYKKYSREIDVLADNKTLKLSVVRGGSFMNTTNFLRCAARDAIDTKLINDIIGFRVVLAPPLPE
jgi:formylglycine-generating enzyme required for sulfatase activity